MFFDKIASIQRPALDPTDSDKENYTQVLGLQRVPVNVQPSSAEDVALSDGVFARTFTIFTTVSGIQKGDRMTVSGTFIDNITQNRELSINGIENWSFGPIPHFEINAVESDK